MGWDCREFVVVKKHTAILLTMCAIEAANELVIFPARNITISTVGGTIIRRKNENQPGRMMNIWHLVLKIDVLL
ncbi:hypothetical protein FZ929_07895 [Klebsiella pneumoniae]|uniref:Uncharacterized protein n=1 Tax=Klebsiella pneumoniae TaxID=573 RepID=A0A5C2LGN0_KLEPN|nr:hypothetical protein FZ929_07895 [Klebsiella pneumoniae]